MQLLNIFTLIPIVFCGDLLGGIVGGTVDVVVSPFVPTDSKTEVNLKKADINLVKHFAWYAAPAVCEKEIIEKFNCSVCHNVKPRKITVMKDSVLTTKGYLAVDDATKHIVLSFRGSHTLLNQLSTIVLVPLPDGFLPTLPIWGPLVHAGFLFDMEALAAQFIATIQQYLMDPCLKDYKIAVVGHSMGGAIASLAAIKLNSFLPWERISLYTYGQLRVGNHAFAHWYNKQPLVAARVVNQRDTIPHLFRTIPGLRHHQNEIWIHENGTIIECETTALEDSRCANSVNVFTLRGEDHLKAFDTVFGSTAC